MKLLTLILALLILMPVQTVLALTPDSESYNRSGSVNFSKNLTGYQNQTTISNIPIQVPTVVELPLSTPDDGFLVIENETGNEITSYFHEEKTLVSTQIFATLTNDGSNAMPLQDGDSTTGVYFGLNNQSQGTTEILLQSATDIEAEALNFILERNVILPATIEISTQDESGNQNIVLARTFMNSKQINFIPTVGNIWLIKLTYNQPLKINELELVQTDKTQNIKRGLRFLAQPNASYTIYKDSAREMGSFFKDENNLQSDSGVMYLPVSTFTNNPNFIESDQDNDGLSDEIDNCVLVTNPDQIDINRNGTGDACEDWDRDNHQNFQDNCPDLFNSDQRDIDDDGIGDKCDDEESRLTEKYTWVPWVGMGFATLVILVLFVLISRRPVVIKSDTDKEEGS